MDAVVIYEGGGVLVGSTSERRGGGPESRSSIRLKEELNSKRLFRREATHKYLTEERESKKKKKKGYCLCKRKVVLKDRATSLLNLVR